MRDSSTSGSAFAIQLTICYIAVCLLHNNTFFRTAYTNQRFFIKLAVANSLAFMQLLIFIQLIVLYSYFLYTVYTVILSLIQPVIFYTAYS